jgi:hypothetical protein
VAGSPEELVAARRGGHPDPPAPHQELPYLIAGLIISPGRILRSLLRDYSLLRFKLNTKKYII